MVDKDATVDVLTTFDVNGLNNVLWTPRPLFQLANFLAESCSFGSKIIAAINDSGKKQLAEELTSDLPTNGRSSLCIFIFMLVEISYPNVPHNTFFRHIQYHEGVNKYKCSECDKAFLQKNDLKKHMRYVILITYYLNYAHYSWNEILKWVQDNILTWWWVWHTMLLPTDGFEPQFAFCVANNFARYKFSYHECALENSSPDNYYCDADRSLI